MARTPGKRHTYKREDIIQQIIDMRINKGMTRLNIQKYLIEEHGYALSYTYELMQDARGEIEARSLQLFADDLKEDIERFEALYAKCIEEGNKKEARENLKEISRLKGHYVERINMSGEITYKAKFDE